MALSGVASHVSAHGSRSCNAAFMAYKYDLVTIDQSPQAFASPAKCSGFPIVLVSTPEFVLAVGTPWLDDAASWSLRTLSSVAASTRLRSVSNNKLSIVAIRFVNSVI